MHWSSLVPSMLARELVLSCTLFWFVFEYILIFLSWNSSSHSSILFWPLLQYSWHVCLCHLTNLLRSNSWLMLLYRDNLLQFIMLYPFLGKTPFMPMAVHSFNGCGVSFRVTCWMFITLLFINFFLFTFLFLLCVSSRGCLSYDSVWCLCNFLFLMWLSLLMLCPISGPFIFRVLEFPSTLNSAYNEKNLHRFCFIIGSFLLRVTSL